MVFMLCCLSFSLSKDFFFQFAKEKHSTESKLFLDFVSRNLCKLWRMSEFESQFLKTSKTLVTVSGNFFFSLVDWAWLPTTIS